MKISTGLPLFFLLITCFTSCKDVKDPVFQDVENIKVGKLSLGTATVSADIRFDNPNRFGLELKTIDCELYVDSAYLGRFTNTSSVTIPAKQEFRLPVKGEVEMIKLIEYSRRAILQEPSAIRVEGKARVGRSGLYRTVPFTYRDTILLKL
jgi:LEA14-like dessication related protein